MYTVVSLPTYLIIVNVLDCSIRIVTMTTDIYDHYSNPTVEKVKAGAKAIKA